MKRKKTINAHDQQILCQLPLHLRIAFPAYLTHKAGISKALGDVIPPCVQNSVGPKRFAKILRELHTLRHARLEYQYLCAIKLRQQQAQRTLDSFYTPALRPFSSFGDKQGYAGYVPSATYLLKVYTSMIDELRPLLDKQVMLLDGKILKGDHSFKIIKSMGKIGGSPTFSALYTMCNEYEEIRMQLLVPTKSLNHLRPSFDGMRDAYAMYGHKAPEIFFTDNVRGDKNFLESVLPSLREDVANPNQHAALPYSRTTDP